MEIHTLSNLSSLFPHLTILNRWRCYTLKIFLRKLLQRSTRQINLFHNLEQFSIYPFPHLTVLNRWRCYILKIFLSSIICIYIFQISLEIYRQVNFFHNLEQFSTYPFPHLTVLNRWHCYKFKKFSFSYSHLYFSNFFRDLTVLNRWRCYSKKFSFFYYSHSYFSRKLLQRSIDKLIFSIILNNFLHIHSHI